MLAKIIFLKMLTMLSLLFPLNFPDYIQKVKDFDPPKGYTRIVFQNDSYSNWMQNLPVKNSKSIMSIDRKINWNRLTYNVFFVIDKPLYFKEDLEQCADYAMRFWADYHKETGKRDNLYLFDYNGSKKYFINSKKTYIDFLKYSMSHSNSYSIWNGANKIISEKLIPGDMFVQNMNGGIGHVSVVIDAAENETGDRIYLVGYSNLPAQEFHVERALTEYGVSGWFTNSGYIKYLKNSRFKKYGEPKLLRFN